MLEFIFDVISAVLFLAAIVLFFRVFLKTSGVRYQFLWVLMLLFTLFFLVAYVIMAYEHATGSVIADVNTIQTWTFLIGSVYVFVVAWLINALVQGFENTTEKQKKKMKKELGAELQKQKELVRNKDHFIFVAAHELRSPITAIKWNMEMLREGKCLKNPDEDDKTIVENLDRSIVQLTDLIHDLLDTSRMEYGTYKITVEPFDMIKAIKEVIKENEYSAQEHQVQVVFKEPEAFEHQVFADKKRTKEALTNLVSNAIKYNKKNGQVVIALQEKDGQVVVEVKDQGIGLSKADLEKLFKKFSRIDRDETEKITGTGLGLFVTEQIIQRMGGRIWVKSPGRGKGSTFGFALPVKKD